MLYDEHGLYGIFAVQDQYVRCTRVGFMASVWKDSCVEFFVQPKPDCGYFNFEFNCGGAWLCRHVTDPRRVGDELAESVPLHSAEAKQVRIYHSMPRIVEPEVAEPTEWVLEFHIPFATLMRYVGSLGPIPGQVWRANFFKCAEDVSHPHWAAWSPVDELNFHLPRCFGSLLLAKRGP
jgi:hypothetical protein